MKKSHEPFDDFPKEQVRSAIRSGIIRAEEQITTPHIKKNNAKRKLVYAFCSVAAVIAILVGSSYFSPALASSLSQIPIIGSIFANSDLIGLQQAQKKGLTNEIGETQTVNGIAVTLDEILYDQNNITVGLYIESEKELDELYFGAGMDFTIDGNFPSGSTGSYGENILSPTTRTAIQEINVTEEMPENFELGLILHGENGEKWYFSTPVQKITDINKIAVNHSQSVDGVDLKVSELSISPTGLSLSYESSEDETDFELSRGGNIEFKVVDQDGNEITGHSGGASGELVKNKIVFKSNKHFDPIDSNVSELTITPYVVIPSGGGGVEVDENGNEKELEYKGDMIQPVEFESFKVRIPQ
ncbi:DUF4179 domain-containing protein [Oceanobacillus caeni]|uniref:DUF4179 domain-containing protein n=1 Tax=Oceanobacillus caeni TaxID=405946 RepID=A0ABR5MFY0_9BACI|nr:MULTISPECIES: DUF4179 domain-containing protein [Bacillaceae]KPH71263.1 hypothetical protein AFL42_15780 [Oceanobacillus caeni]MBU8792020.1 DUF4179 domain-containing protein [Oceanobacillus caeni]MCR1835691.1 DUF4179 domain-containing protein [Oceanobacillus caeni]MED4474440.1 DUF4179 domain-containing protein [Oceanobacillus caeni]